MLAFALDASVGVFTGADFINTFPLDNKPVTCRSDLVFTVIAAVDVCFPSYRISPDSDMWAGPEITIKLNVRLVLLSSPQ